ncbi:restriction endonuclease subunit S [Mucilaginibacter sp. HMF5004]|uniref:restriction endonuclease subunit S n=1 Tax=Mucilaginibacter rivuli TaxID=2857527 RepID=UPI001C5F14FA|nr:restriction endonuclease subunit S [Mucilaginibacter rivuli]MBW4890636.1 restriction endonuclease subunit S [Mucilaginibacter rivuli]
MILLKEMAIIKTGYTFRGKIENDETHGSINVLQPKDITDGAPIDKIAKINPNAFQSIDNHLLLSGDILIANKGLKFSTYIYHNSAIKTIASSSFFIIRVNQSKISPDFLMWYLNQMPAKDYLLNKTTGTTIPTISKSAIESLSIPVPTLDKQLLGVNLISEIKKESNLLESLIVKRMQLRDSYLWSLIH